MSTAGTPTATKIRDWAPDGNTVQPVAGEGGFAALGPVYEPISAGSPPVAPSAITPMTVQWKVAAVRVRSGHLRTSVQQAANEERPRFRVVWGPITSEARNALAAFLRDDCRGGERGFTIDPDGTGETITVRAVEPLTDAYVSRGVFEIDGIEVEQVFG